MIYRDMPAVWDPAFRPQFYARWGRESAVISARTRRAEYPEYQQLLSIKAARHGTENYFVDGRRLAVDDDTYLVLNAGRRYGSRIDALEPIHTFSIFFAPRMAEEALNSLKQAADILLDGASSPAYSRLEFEECVREHDDVVTPRMRLIAQNIDDGCDDALWLEEQLHLLLESMVAREHRDRKAVQLVPSARPATRRELYRRLNLARSFIHSAYRSPITLKDMASAAHLSPFHFLRLFRAVYHTTPSAYLKRRRAMAARHLMRRTQWTLIEIAESVGFGSRTSLFRHLKALAD